MSSARNKSTLNPEKTTLGYYVPPLHCVRGENREDHWQCLSELMPWDCLTRIRKFPINLSGEE